MNTKLLNVFLSWPVVFHCIPWIGRKYIDYIFKFASWRHRRSLPLIFFKRAHSTVNKTIRRGSGHLRSSGVRRQVGENNGSFDDVSYREIKRARLSQTRIHLEKDKVPAELTRAMLSKVRSRALLTFNSVSPENSRKFSWSSQSFKLNAITSETNSFGMYKTTCATWSMCLMSQFYKIIKYT